MWESSFPSPHECAFIVKCEQKCDGNVRALNALLTPILTQVDPFHEKKLRAESHTLPSEDMGLTKFTEAMLGSASPSLRRKPGSIRDELAQYLENNRKVLSFDGIVKGFSTASGKSASFGARSDYGDNLVYKVNFFLEDDTMMIVEQHTPNSGRYKFPALLNRQRIPMGGVVVELGKKSSKTRYFRATDLRVGKTIEVMCRKIFLFNADGFTMKWCDIAYSNP